MVSSTIYEKKKKQSRVRKRMTEVTMNKSFYFSKPLASSVNQIPTSQGNCAE